MGTTFVTQLLSMFGIAGEVNLMVWAYGSIFESVLCLITVPIIWYAYDAYWSVSEDATSAQQANAALALSGLESDLIRRTAYSTSAAVALYMHHEAWFEA